MFWQTTTAEPGSGGPPDPGGGPASGRLLSCEQELLAVRADLAAAGAAWISPAGKAFRAQLYEYRTKMAESAELLRWAAAALDAVDAALDAADAATGAAQAAEAALYGRIP